MHDRLRSRIRAALTSAAILLPALAVTTAATPLTASASTTRLISSGGTTSFIAAPSGGDPGAVQNPEIRPGPSEGALAPAGPDVTNTGGGANGTGEAAGAHANPALQLTFQGLNHRQQRLANGGNQFSLEPPDQGLCAGNGSVLETINDVLRVFDYNGNPRTPAVDLNTFLGYPAAINRTTGARGPFVTDPSCYYDPGTQRWFHTVLTIDVNPANGRFLGPNHIDLAVSNTADPTGSWTIYRIPVQDDGTAGTPDHGCSGGADKNNNPVGHGPCFGDFPHLGADSNGFYVTTNEYSFFGPEFHAAQVYAFSKRDLAAGKPSVAVTQIDTFEMDRGNSGFTLAPAAAPSGGDVRANAGTEFFLSSNAGDEAHGNGIAVGPRTSTQIIVWSLSHTRSLNSPEPDLDLEMTYLNVGRYSMPPPSAQKAGSIPLADCLNNDPCSIFLNGVKNPFKPEVEYALDSSDTRMMQTTLAAGKLWSALDTVLNGKAGIEYFEVSIRGEEPRLSRSGYLGLAGQNVTYPTIGVNGAGKGVMGFTVLGTNHFPSAGYAAIDGHGVGAVNIIKEGLGPSDGFTGYKFFGYNRPRWGDYGASAVVGNTIWIASEMINQTCTLAQYEGAPFGGTGAFGSCGGTRTSLANWSTEISKLTVG
jgi:hypothetical protein